MRAIFASVALCTHLGCVPSFRPEPGSQSDWPGGLVFKGTPAPVSLLVPRYSFLAQQRLVIGRDADGEAT
jgi:ubiquinol-cytochrome c reductase iron-sulfur subunit